MATRIGPEYQRLTSEIRSWITSGKYSVAERIPSTVELHKLTGMSVPVVRRAVDQLKAEGILEGHPGKGVYVKATPAEVENERQDIDSLSKQVAALQREIHELAERVLSSQPDDIRESVGRLEANLIDLYGKLGYNYPQDSARDGARAAARRGQSKR